MMMVGGRMKDGRKRIMTFFLSPPFLMFVDVAPAISSLQHRNAKVMQIMRPFPSRRIM